MGKHDHYAKYLFSYFLKFCMQTVYEIMQYNIHSQFL